MPACRKRMAVRTRWDCNRQEAGFSRPFFRAARRCPHYPSRNNRTRVHQRKNPLIYRQTQPPIFIFLLTLGADVHADLLQCMNRVYLRGCEAKYLQPLFGAPDFCENRPPENTRRRLEGELGYGGGGRGAPTLTMPGAAASDGEGGGAGSLVIHIRSGDIFLPKNAERLKRDFLGYGQVRMSSEESLPTLSNCVPPSFRNVGCVGRAGETGAQTTRITFCCSRRILLIF